MSSSKPSPPKPPLPSLVGRIIVWALIQECREDSFVTWNIFFMEWKYLFYWMNFLMEWKYFLMEQKYIFDQMKIFLWWNGNFVWTLIQGWREDSFVAWTFSLIRMLWNNEQLLFWCLVMIFPSTKLCLEFGMTFLMIFGPIVMQFNCLSTISDICLIFWLIFLLLTISDNSSSSCFADRAAGFFLGGIVPLPIDFFNTHSVSNSLMPYFDFNSPFQTENFLSKPVDCHCWLANAVDRKDWWLAKI